MGDIVVNFTVRTNELLQDAEDRLMQKINGEIGFFDEEADEEIQIIGRLKVHLFHVGGMLDENWHFFDLYDCHSRHLADSLDLIYKSEVGEFRAGVIKKAGFDVEEMIEWHLNITRLDIEPSYRGERCGVRAMKLLRQFVARTGLIVTAKAYPEPRDEPRAPSPAEVKKLRTYYASEPSLGFKPVGRVSDGWLLANWSTP